ncbi:flagellar hook-associated protein 3 [Geomonas limicola]|uniref:Flagellin n=1 Tax=Geomonas limicola TaxID=2740186 RepID=A0A6V8NGI4_9BACT|nr:flagellin [Geomonas limicola]GFO70867.1 flagellar hook-associated protein 3 [Geomonas limicola]
MRITNGMTANNALYNLQKGLNNLNDLNGSVSSGLNVSKPSEDPLSARQLLDLQEQVNVGKQYTANITKAKLLLNVTSTALNGMGDVMTQLKTTAGSIANGSSDPTVRSAAVSNLTELKKQLIDYGNTQSENQYVFGGFSTGQPFDTAGNFSGTNDSLDVNINQGSTVTTNVSGGQLLRGGTPPAAVGSGATAGQSPVDIIGSIDALISSINSNNTSGIQDGIKNMQAASQQVTASISSVAGRLTRLENMQTMITNNQNTLEGIYSDKQNVDYAKAGVELSQLNTAYSAALSTTAKINQLSLLDYLK